MSDVKRDNTLITPQQMLRDLADQYDAGTHDHPHVIVLTLDTRNKQVSWGSFMANIRSHEAVAVTSIANHHFAGGFEENGD